MATEPDLNPKLPFIVNKCNAMCHAKWNLMYNCALQVAQDEVHPRHAALPSCTTNGVMYCPNPCTVQGGWHWWCPRWPWSRKPLLLLYLPKLTARKGEQWVSSISDIGISTERSTSGASKVCVLRALCMYKSKLSFTNSLWSCLCWF